MCRIYSVKSLVNRLLTSHSSMVYAVVACTVLMLSAQQALAAVYYVDYSGGSDSSSGLSQSYPWKHSPGMSGATGTPAATTLSAGDIVYFKSGVTWPSSALPLRPTQSGTASNPITFKVKSDWGTGSYAIFDAQLSVGHCFDLDNYDQLQYITLDGFWFKDATNSEVFIRENKDIVIQNCKVTHTNSANPLIHTQRKTSVINCYVDGTGNTGVQSGVVRFQGASQSDTNMAGSILSGNEIITGSNDYGVKLYGVPSGIVEKNYIHGSTNSGQYMIAWRTSDPGTIRFNVIDARGAGSAMASWTATATGHKVYNNVLIGDGSNSGAYIASDTYDGFNFKNNIFYNFSTCIASNSDATMTNNVLYSCNTTTSGTGAITSSNNLTSNPAMVNVNSLPSGVQLQSSSPAINAGVAYDSYFSGGNSDYFGYVVPAGSAPDIGAYEYGSVGGSIDALSPASPGIPLVAQP